MTSAGKVHNWLLVEEARNFKRSNIHPCIRAMSTGEGSRSRTARNKPLKMCRIRIVLRRWCGRVSSCPALCGEVLLLAAALAPAPLVPIRPIFPVLLSPLVRRSAPVLLLGR